MHNCQNLEGEIVGRPLYFSDAVDHHVKDVVPRLVRVEDGDIVSQTRPPVGRKLRHPLVPELVILLIRQGIAVWVLLNVLAEFATV